MGMEPLREGRDHTFVEHTAPSGIVFASGIDGCTLYQIKFFNCEKWGNYENQCLEPMVDETPNKPGQNLAQIGRCLAKVISGGAVRNNWIILDLCSTIRCAKNDLIVSKVTVIPSEEHPSVYINGGHMDYTMRGILDILPMDIYVNDKSMANIVSL